MGDKHTFILTLFDPTDADLIKFAVTLTSEEVNSSKVDRVSFYKECESYWKSHIPDYAVGYPLTKVEWIATNHKAEHVTGTPAGQVSMTTQSAGVTDSEDRFAMGWFALPADHWMFTRTTGFESPPMPMRTGDEHPRRKELNEMVTAAARYAIRATTRQGTVEVDPDELVEHMITGLLGYNTPDGTIWPYGWANPTPLPEPFAWPEGESQ